MATAEIDSEEMSSEEELLGGEMTLIEHLAELRKRLFVCVAAVAVGTVVAFIFWQPILNFLETPLPIAANSLSTHGGQAKLVVTGIGEGFSTVLKLSFAVGAALAAPVWIYQLWAFISPALTRREKRHALPFTLVGVGLFLAGLTVGFVVLRFPINFLIDFGNHHFQELITADNYLTFIAFFMLVFGVVFELPLVLTFMAVMGIVTSQQLAKNRAYALLGLWVVSCFITPGADPYSPVILGVAFTILYLISELLIRAIHR